MARIRGPFKMCVFVMTRHSHHGMFSSRCFELPAHVAEVPPLIAQTHAIKIVRRRRQPWHFGTARELVDSAARLHTGGFWGEKHDRVHSMDPSHCATSVPLPPGPPWFSLATRVSMLRFSSSQSCIHFMPAVCGTCFPRVSFMQCAVTCLVLSHTLVSSTL